jgi:hypothetical protein
MRENSTPSSEPWQRIDLDKNHEPGSSADGSYNRSTKPSGGWMRFGSECKA